MKKKIISFLLCLTLLCTLSSPLVVSASSDNGIYLLLSELSIMQGDPDGNLRLEDPVTRAEFTKMAVAASSYKNSVATNLAISPFPDVTYKHWAASYVRVGVVNGLVSGYPDATFRPDDTVLFEEGITILLRVLGYSDADFGASWPSGQISLADNLEITEGLDLNAGDTLNRGQVAKLIYQTLSTKMKGQNQQLSSVSEVTITDDITLISDSTDDSSIASDEVYTSGGTYKITDSFDRTWLGMIGEIAVKNNKLLSFVPSEESSENEQYLLYAVLPNALMVYKNGYLTSLSVADSTPVYKGKSQSSFVNLKNSLELGDVLRVKKGENGEIDFITCRSGDIKGPVTVSASGWSSTWATDANTKVMRNGTASTLTALAPFDIAYFIPEMNLVLAYSDKVTGVYESASPNQDMPQSVTVSGKTYEIESAKAFTALASGGTFTTGDTVTLLLGKDGAVADVISPNASALSNMVGFVLETGRKTHQSGSVNAYTSDYVQVAFSDGTVQEYATTADYSALKNQVVEIGFVDGFAKLTAVDNDKLSPINGTYSHANRRLGSSVLAKDISILDLGSWGESGSSQYCTVYPQRLDGVTIASSKIIYYDKNEDGEIVQLFLDNVTGDMATYGFMVSAEQTEKKTENNSTLIGNYEYLADGMLYSLNTNGVLYSVSSGMGVKITGSVQNPDGLISLQSPTGNAHVVSASTVRAGGKNYPISPGVSVYKKNAYPETYTQIPLSSIIGNEELTLSVYYDKSPESGGQIRVIIVRN